MASRRLILIVVLLAVTARSKGDDKYPKKCYCDDTGIANYRDAKLYTVPSNILCESSDLFVVDLSRNNINTLENGSFKDLVILRDLVIANSHVKLVHKEAFQNLKLLVTLDLSSNEIQYLHSETFQDLENLQDLYLRRNPLKRLQNTIFSGQKRLKILDLRSCELTSISANVFHYNKIHFLVISTPYSRYKTSTWPRGVYINMYDNSLNCVCDLKDFHDFVLSTHDSINPLYENLTCTKPQELNGVRLRAVESSNFQKCKPYEKIPILRNSTLRVSTGLNITLSCRIENDSQLERRWTFNPSSSRPRGNLLARSINASLRHTLSWSNKWHNATIENVRKSDEGTYKCEVYDNTLKLNSYRTVSLFVFESPSLTHSKMEGPDMQWLAARIAVSAVLFILVLLVVIIVIASRKRNGYNKTVRKIKLWNFMIPVPFYESADKILPKRPLPSRPISEAALWTDNRDDHQYEEVHCRPSRWATHSLIPTTQAANIYQQKEGTYDSQHYLRPVTRSAAAPNEQGAAHEYMTVLPTEELSTTSVP